MKYPGSAATARRALLCVALAWPAAATAQTAPPVPPEYARFFVQYGDARSTREKLLNFIGLSGVPVGRSFALVAGVSKYPRMKAPDNVLEAAAADISKVAAYLKDQEAFDEIVIVRDEDMTYDNLAFFLQSYFPDRLKQFPNSRFLFAYSGHGMADGKGPIGYVLRSTATSLSDRNNSISLNVIRDLIEPDVENGHHVLALINACHSGAFLKRAFGGNTYLPRLPGAHAITAGGSKELSWHVPDVGAGSVFFEKFLAGLGGQADISPRGGDGVITIDEITTYLKQEVRIVTDQRQNPIAGDLSPDGSLGGFFFFSRLRSAASNAVPAWNPLKAVGFGTPAVRPAVPPVVATPVPPPVTVPAPTPPAAASPATLVKVLAGAVPLQNAVVRLVYPAPTADRVVNTDASGVARFANTAATPMAVFVGGSGYHGAFKERPERDLEFRLPPAPGGGSIVLVRRGSIPGLTGTLEIRTVNGMTSATGNGLLVNGREGAPVPVVKGTPFSVSDTQHARSVTAVAFADINTLVDYGDLTVSSGPSLTVKVLDGTLGVAHAVVRLIYPAPVPDLIDNTDATGVVRFVKPGTVPAALMASGVGYHGSFKERPETDLELRMTAFPGGGSVVIAGSGTIPGLSGTLSIQVAGDLASVTGNGLLVNGQEGVPVAITTGTRLRVSDAQHARDLTVLTRVLGTALVDFADLTTASGPMLSVKVLAGDALLRNATVRLVNKAPRPDREVKTDANGVAQFVKPGAIPAAMLVAAAGYHGAYKDRPDGDLEVRLTPQVADGGSLVIYGNGSVPGLTGSLHLEVTGGRASAIGRSGLFVNDREETAVPIPNGTRVRLSDKQHVREVTILMVVDYSVLLDYSALTNK